MTNLKATKRKKQIREIGFYIALVAFPLLHWLVFWLYVNAQTIVMTFQRYDGVSLQPAWFDNYIELIPKVFFGGEQRLFRAFLNSFHSIVINLMILPIAVVSAYAFFKKIPCEKYFRVMFYLPNMISMVVLTMCFRYMFFNSDFTFIGPLAKIFNLLGYNVDWFDVIEKSDTVWPLIYTYCIWAGFGVNVIMICGNMQRIPTDLEDACKIDGVGFWRELVTVVVPLIMPTISVFIVTSITGVFGFTYPPMFITGSVDGGSGGQAYTLSWWIFDQVNAQSTDSLIDATTVGISWSLLMLPIILIAKWLSKKFTPEVDF